MGKSLDRHLIIGWCLPILVIVVKVEINRVLRTRTKLLRVVLVKVLYTIRYHNYAVPFPIESRLVCFPLPGCRSLRFSEWAPWKSQPSSVGWWCQSRCHRRHRHSHDWLMKCVAQCSVAPQEFAARYALGKVASLISENPYALRSVLYSVRIPFFLVATSWRYCLPLFPHSPLPRDSLSAMECDL